MQYKPDPESKLGIFWIDDMSDDILSVTVPMDRATRYGSILGANVGHPSSWKKVQHLSCNKGLKFDNLPRGRVFFDTANGMYTISVTYFMVQSTKILDKVIELFNLDPDKVNIQPYFGYTVAPYYPEQEVDSE